MDFISALQRNCKLRRLDPLYRCVFALPVGDLVRCPVKWLHLAELSLAVLAAWGIAPCVVARS